MEPFLEKAAMWESVDKKGMWVGTEFTVENQSDRDGSISRAELLVQYQSDLQTLTIRIPHSPSSPGSDSNPVLKVPSRLLANNTSRGWLKFIVPIEFFSQKTIEDMKVEFRDPRGVTVQRNIHAPMEVASDPTQA